MSGAVSEAKEAIVGAGSGQKSETSSGETSAARFGKEPKTWVIAPGGNGCVIELLQQPAYWVDVTICSWQGCNWGNHRSF